MTMDKNEENNFRIEEIKAEIEEKQEEHDNISDDGRTEQYDNMLDECTGDINIGNITLSPSRVLSECDPIAYSCGYSEFIDEELSQLYNEIEELKKELKELEGEKGND